METAPFFVLLFAHLSALILGFGSVLVTDFYGMLWVFDRVRFPQVVRVSGVTEKIIWAGWFLMVGTGAGLLALKGAIDNLMVMKIFFVALIGINGIPLHLLHERVRGYRDGDQIPDLVMFGLVFSLTVSQLGWWGAVSIGFLHRHVQSVIQWPAEPWILIAVIVAALAAVFAVGVGILKWKQAR